MDFKKTLAALAAAATLTAVSVDALAQAQSTSARAGAAESPSMSTSEFRRWQRNWDQRLLDMWEADPARYAWGKEKRAIKSQVVVLDPPIGEFGPPDKVTVEWFYAPIDERSMILAPVNASVVMRRWEETIKEAGETRIHIIPRIVSKGPGVPVRFEPQLRLIQDMIYAWGDNPWKGDAFIARVALNKATRAPETAHRVRVLLAHRDAVGRGRPLHRLRSYSVSKIPTRVRQESCGVRLSSLELVAEHAAELRSVTRRNSRETTLEAAVCVDFRKRR